MNIREGEGMRVSFVDWLQSKDRATIVAFVSSIHLRKLYRWDSLTFREMAEFKHLDDVVTVATEIRQKSRYKTCWWVFWTCQCICTSLLSKMAHREGLTISTIYNSSAANFSKWRSCSLWVHTFHKIQKHFEKTRRGLLTATVSRHSPTNVTDAVWSIPWFLQWPLGCHPRSLFEF